MEQPKKDRASTGASAPAPKPLTFAERLEGMTVGEWYVEKRIGRPIDPDITGGYFSVGYVVNRKGQQAFLKAFDLERILANGGGTQSPITALASMTSGFEFERSLLRSTKRMDRVVQSIADGDDLYVEPGNAFSIVPYIIFEKADYDVRRHFPNMAAIDVKQRLRILHHVATGLMQLHNGKIAHQDLKPSNILVWRDSLAKIADLGRSSSRGQISENDYFAFAGDLKYAPPESLYNYLHSDWDQRRLPIDLYLFGSIIVFLFTQVSMSSLIMGRHLTEQHRPQGAPWHGKWTGTFEDVLPYLEHAFVNAMTEFEASLPEPLNMAKDYRIGLTQIVRDMCQPNPQKRGTIIRGVERSLQLNRIVTILDRLRYDC